jgi:hypothetical protein
MYYSINGFIFQTTDNSLHENTSIRNKKSGLNKEKREKDSVLRYQLPER